MGLAATQARFLAITSRKARCEFESMQIAQQKLSLSRELEQATQDYQTALDTTKIVWDPDGSGATPFDFCYDLAMYSSDVNDYTPFMISRTDGRIALNSVMARAAKLAGIPEDGTTGTEDMFNKFIEAMVSTGGMTETAAAGARLLGYQALAGLGGELIDKTQTADMNLGNFINFIDLKIENSVYTIMTDQENHIFSENYELSMQIPAYNASKDLYDEHYYAWNKEHTHVNDYGKYPVKLSGMISYKEDSNYLSMNGVRYSNDGGKNGGQKQNHLSYTLSDLLTGDITFAFTRKNKSDDPTKFWKSLLQNSDSFLSSSSILDGKADLFSLIGVTVTGSESGESSLMYNGKKLDDDERLVMEALNQMVTGFANVLDVSQNENDIQAFNYAILETLSLLSRSKDLGSENYSSDAYKAVVNGSSDYNCWVTKKASSGRASAISMSSLAESFLTFFAQGKAGYTAPYYIIDSAVNSYYVTDDQAYLYPVAVVDDGKTATELYNAEYYSILFNTLCQDGWYENSYIDDKDYLQNAMKNGKLFVTTLNEEDGYYYQERFNNNKYLTVITDEDAVTQAERDYATAKSRIQYKEEELEIDMKNLDIEISSLTTEYEAIKSMISKNIDKTFKLFQD